MEQPIFFALASTRVICENGIPMPKPLSTVAQQLKEWRARNNLSQAQAVTVFKAGSLPVIPDSLQNWESGRNSPSPLAAEALADFLNRHQKVTPPNQPKEKNAN